jgi:DNA-binding PadR family transcriptional regulator
VFSSYHTFVEQAAQIKVTSLVKLYVLLSLREGAKHGYELMKEIEKHTGSKPSTSLIYPFLDQLKEAGLVEVEETGSREKKVYALTSKGERFVGKKLAMFESIITSTIEKDLAKCAHCGCEVYKGGYEMKIDGEKLLFCCMHCARTYMEP